MDYNGCNAREGSYQVRVPKGPLSVLVVDDDELIQSSMEAMLNVLGHTSRIAASGEEALAELEAGLVPDVVILDLAMPGLGGERTLPLLRALCPDVPVLVTTGRADPAVWQLVAAHSYLILLPKPFTLEDLRGVLDSWTR
jgi:CheY-like chemotaxis protein